MDANESAACVGAACRSSVGTATEGPVAVRLGPINYEQQFLLLVMLLLLLLISQSLQAGTLAQFRTVLGDLEVELFEADKPVTVQNFIRYVQSGVYSNMFFHRYVPGFVIQGGGYFTTNRSTASPSLAAVDGFGPITNEFNVGARRSNVLGTLAMAKLGGDPNSASSEWFFNLADNSANLDQQNGGFTVFGRVVGSTQVLNQLTNLIRVDAGGPFTELPVLNFPPSYEDLVYVDITLLDVRVARDRKSVV